MHGHTPARGSATAADQPCCLLLPSCVSALLEAVQRQLATAWACSEGGRLGQRHAAVLPCSARGAGRTARRQACRQRPLASPDQHGPAARLPTAMHSPQEHRVSVDCAWTKLDIRVRCAADRAAAALAMQSRCRRRCLPPGAVHRRRSACTPQQQWSPPPCWCRVPAWRCTAPCVRYERSGCVRAAASAGRQGKHKSSRKLDSIIKAPCRYVV